MSTNTAPSAREVAEFILDNMPVKFVGRMMFDAKTGRMVTPRNYAIELFAGALDAFKADKLVLERKAADAK